MLEEKTGVTRYLCAVGDSCDGSEGALLHDLARVLHEHQELADERVHVRAQDLGGRLLAEVEDRRRRVRLPPGSPQPAQAEPGIGCGEQGQQVCLCMALRRTASTLCSHSTIYIT